MYTLNKQIRHDTAGVAGVFAYIASEVLFWFISLPAGIVFYHQVRYVHIFIGMGACGAGACE